MCCGFSVAYAVYSSWLEKTESSKCEATHTFPQTFLCYLVQLRSFIQPSLGEGFWTQSLSIWVEEASAFLTLKVPSFLGPFPSFHFVCLAPPCIWLCLVLICSALRWKLVLLSRSGGPPFESNVGKLGQKLCWRCKRAPSRPSLRPLQGTSLTSSASGISDGAWLMEGTRLMEGICTCWSTVIRTSSPQPVSPKRPLWAPTHYILLIFLSCESSLPLIDTWCLFAKWNCFHFNKVRKLCQYVWMVEHIYMPGIVEIYKIVVPSLLMKVQA